MSASHILQGAELVRFKKQIHADQIPAADLVNPGLALGYHFTAIEDYASAKDVYDILLEKKVNEWRVHEMGARTLSTLGDASEAQAAYEASYALNPDNRAMHFPLGDKYIALGCHGEALKIFRDAIRLFIESAPDLIRVAERLIVLEDYDSAVVATLAALSLDRNSEIAQYHRDFALSGSRHFDALLKTYDGQAIPPPKRLFIGGCGRSGTWLCEQIFSCFDDCAREPVERHFGRFAYLEPGKSLHVLKRMHNTHKVLEYLPTDVGLIYMIRHPFDVLTSRHIDQDRFITYQAWLLEYQVFEKIKNRSNTIILKYEDLISNPDDFEEKLQSQFGIIPARPIQQFFEVAKPSEHVAVSMHSIRPLDTARIGSHLKSVGNIQYCAKLLREHKEKLSGPINALGYEIDPQILSYV